MAVLTSAALLSIVCCAPRFATTASDAKVLERQRHGEHGFVVDVTVSRTSDGTISSTALVDQPTTDDRVVVRTDGITVWWIGTVAGELITGSLPATELPRPGSPPEPVCLYPVAAIICVGAALALLGGCALGFRCDGSPPLQGQPSNMHRASPGHDTWPPATRLTARHRLRP
jgi:hypothetical protein